MPGEYIALYGKIISPITYIKHVGQFTLNCDISGVTKSKTINIEVYFGDNSLSEELLEELIRMRNKDLDTWVIVTGPLNCQGSKKNISCTLSATQIQLTDEKHTAGDHLGKQ